MGPGSSARPCVTISVVIPAYNAAHFLPRCLESVAGIQHATGEWIAFLDADDIWSPKKLEIQADRIQAGTVLVYTGTRVFDDSGVRQLCPAIHAERAGKMLRYLNPITNSSVIARRDALLKVGGFREDIRGPEDWDMWFRLSRLGGIASVEDPLTHYYVYPTSLSADPHRIIANVEKMLHSTLVSDLDGLPRWAWVRRIRAVQLYSAAVIARENGLDGEMAYMLRSLLSWPSPSWKPGRFIGAAVTARKQLLRSRAHRLEKELQETPA